jgi:hypothetical protein
MSRSSELANRFKSAIQRQEDEAKQSVQADRIHAEEEQRRREAAEAARSELIEELKAFGEALGFEAKQTAKNLLIRSAGRSLALSLGDPERLGVRYEGSTTDDLLSWDGSTWTLRLGDHSMPLFDAGLEELGVRAFGLPRPEGSPEPSEAAPPEPPPSAEAPAEVAVAPADEAHRAGISRPVSSGTRENPAPTVSRKTDASAGSQVRELKPWW